MIGTDATAVLMEVENLSRMTADSRIWLLRDVSLALRIGECLFIVGHSGSGKTLLMRSLAMLDPISAGQILWRGQPVLPRLIPAFRAQVTYLHQRPALMEGTVEDNLRFPFTLAIHSERRFDRQYILELLQVLDRGEEFLRRNSRALSGGEAQIVALIRALQIRPSVILLDEPTASLDAESAQAIEQLVQTWHNESGFERATVWVTHDREQSARWASRVITMSAGGR